MEEKIKEESLDGFANLLSNLKAERFFGVSHNNSKDDLNLLGDLLDLQKLDKDNLLDTKDFIALDPLHETFEDPKNNEFVERAFKVELSLNSEPFIIFSRNNGIAKRQKKKRDSQSPLANQRDEIMDEMQYPETIENYLSLPLREETHLDFTLQPPTLSTEMTNFESLGPNRNIVSDLPNIPGQQRSENLEIRQDAPTFSNTVQENIPFILGHPGQMSQISQMGQMGMLKEPEADHDNDFIRVEKKENREFSIHEISFNRDQFSNSMRTDQDTARSLQLAKHYEMVEEEADNGGMTNKKRNVDEFPLQMNQDRYRDNFKVEVSSSQKSIKEESISPFMKPPEPIKNFGLEKIINENIQEHYKSESENMDNNTLAAENHLLNIFYQLMNENKQLKQEMGTVNERLDEFAKHKEAETEIILNLQQNLELTMMLLKKRDDEFTKLQKKHDDLSRNFQNYIDQQTSAPALPEYYLGPSRSNSFLSPQDMDQQVNCSRELPMDRSTRRSSSFTSAVHNGVRTSKTDLQRPVQNENLRSQKSFPTHFSETHSMMDHDMGYDNSIEQRRNSSYCLRTSAQQNLDKRDPNYDTSGEYDSRYGNMSQSYNQNMYPNNKVLQNLAKKSGFGNQQIIQERDDFTNNFKQQNVKGQKSNENISAKNWQDKEQERGGMKENRYGQNTGNRTSSLDPNNSNSSWTGGNAKQNVGGSNDGKPKSKGQNYKKYSEMFKRQKEAFDQGMNVQREEIKSKIQPRK